MTLEDHPTKDALSQFALGNLPDSEFDAIDRHLHQCGQCWDAFMTSINQNDSFVALVRSSAAGSADSNDTIASPTLKTTLESRPLEVSTRYRLLEQVASGGMGVIWIANDQLLNREVAIKVLRDEDKFSEEARRSLQIRFVRESQIVSSLQHPGIPPIYDLGKLSDGKPFLAMKLIRGRTLAQKLADPTAPSIEWLLEVFSSVCQTVAFAHSRGVVHRDLKPDNIMVGQFGETQVMDWGISESSREDGPKDRTRSQSITGTPGYMSPEQANGRPCDPPADVFALGAVLCEMLTGSPAYRGKDTRELMTQATAGDVSDAISRLRNCSADPQVIRLAESCLAADVEQRPANAEELANGLTQYLHSAQTRLREAELERAKSEARAQELMRRRRTQWWLALSAVCLVGASLAAWRFQRKQVQTQVIQTNAAITDTLRESANARPVSEGGTEQYERALAAAERGFDLSRETNDRSLQLKAQRLRTMLTNQCEAAHRLEELHLDLQNAMLFDEGSTVEKRFANRQELLRQAVEDGRRSTMLFLQFPATALIPGASENSTSDGRPPRGRMPRPALGRRPPPPRSSAPRPGGRMRQPSREDYVSGKVHVHRYAEVRLQDYEQAFSKFGIQAGDSPEDVLRSLAGFDPVDREVVNTGLSMWFLFAADARSETAHWLATLLPQLGRQTERSNESLEWSDAARQALLARDIDAVDAACEAARPIMADLPPELLWGVGCFHRRCSENGGNNRLLRLAQCHFMDNFLLNRELSKLARHELAMPFVTGALAKYTDYKLSIQLARHMLAVGKDDEYEIVRDHCFAQYPDDPIMFADWGDLMGVHHRPEAIDAYAKAIELGFPAPQMMLARMGQLYQISGAPDLAMWAYRDALELEDLPDEHRIELEAAIESLPKAVDEDEGSTDSVIGATGS